MFIKTRIYFTNSQLFWLQKQRNETQNGMKRRGTPGQQFCSQFPSPCANFYPRDKLLPELKVRFILKEKGKKKIHHLLETSFRNSGRITWGLVYEMCAEHLKAASFSCFCPLNPSYDISNWNCLVDPGKPGLAAGPAWISSDSRRVEMMKVKERN